jgi:anaerobic magnesium-protoporphyrin IX monomethyl ester cyclase
MKMIIPGSLRFAEHREKKFYFVYNDHMAKTPVDVLFINPGSLREVYQELSHEFSAIEPPSLAAMFATYVRNQGLSTAIVDAPALGLGPTSTAKRVMENYAPTLVVIVVYGFQPSASTQNMPAAGQIARELKAIDPHVRILMTGTHPAALPERTMREESIDFLCDREGPETILKTAQQLKKARPDWDGIPSLWYRDGGQLLHNPEAPLMENLDEAMPGAAWDLLPMDKYRAHNWHAFERLHARSPYASLHTSLGCPFKCSFCCINSPFGKPSYRTWSPSLVAREIDHLVRTYKVHNIKFVDEMFVLNKAHVMGICDELIALGHDLNIWAYARIDTIRDEFLDKLRLAGFRWLALGIESGSKHVRDGVEKGRFGTADIIKTVRKVQDAGINVIGNFIFGLPDDDFTSMQETLDLAIETNCEFANFYSAMAYPGSRLYGMATENKWELPATWMGYSQHSFESLPLRTNFLTSAQVLKFRDDAFHTYFTNDKYLDMVNRKFGPAVVDHLKRMVQIRLKRQLYPLSAERKAEVTL